MKYVLFTDGGSRGNPGHAASAAILKDSAGKIVSQTGAYVGVATNNVAEYRALVIGLTMAIEMKVKDITCCLDSELVVRQMQGSYKVKNERMKQLWGEVNKLTKTFDTIEFKHITRDKNSEADALVNNVLDELKK